MIQVNTQPPICFLYHLEETTVNQLHTFIERGIPQKVQLDALQHGMRITGPVYWNYFGFTGDENKPFILEIAIPIDALKDDYTGMYKQRQSEAYQCIVATHEGDWMKIPETYGKVFAFAAEQGLTPSGHNRELYLNADFNKPQNNITQIQLGIK